MTPIQKLSTAILLYMLIRSIVGVMVFDTCMADFGEWWLCLGLVL